LASLLAALTEADNFFFIFAIYLTYERKLTPQSEAIK
jgi:hypothetical protein